MANYTVDALLLPTLKRRGLLPNTQETLADTDYLALANDELQSYIVPLILRAREEYLVTSTDIAVVAGTQAYPIPSRAVGGKVRNVQISDATSSTTYRQLARVEPEQCPDVGSGGGMWGYYFQGNNIVLSASPTSGGTLRVTYHLMPSELVAVAQCAPITSIASLSSKILTATAVSGWATAATSYDVVKAKPGFDTYELENSATRSSNTFTFTDDLDTHIVVGDYVEITASNWPLAAQRVYRASVVAADVITLLGLDATDTTKYPAGGGASSTGRRIITWANILQVNADTLAVDGGEFTCRMTIGDAEASPVTDGPSLRQEARIPALASVAEVRPKMIALGLTRTLGQGDRVLVDDGREFGVATCRLDGLGGLLLQLTDATMLGAGMGRQL
jgi:hypothetical protein